MLLRGVVVESHFDFARRKKIIAAVIIFAAAAGLLALYARGGRLSVSELEGYKLGTVVRLAVYTKDEKRGGLILSEAMGEVSRMEGLFSVNIASSEVSRINAAAGREPVKISRETMELLERALYMARESGGAFDPTVGPLVALWGIGTEHAKVPSAEEIKRALSYINYSLVKIDKENSSAYAASGQRIDLGGIAKGYIADKLSVFLRGKGAASALIDLGGNLAVVGKAPSGEPWRLGLQHPLKPRGEYFAVVSASDESVVTSGPYERYFEKDGVRYHHIFDTKTGYPAKSDLASVSVVSKSSADADAYCTALFVAGLHKSLEFLRLHPDIKAVLVSKDGSSVYVSSALKERFSLRDNSMKLSFYGEER